MIVAAVIATAAVGAGLIYAVGAQGDRPAGPKPTAAAAQAVPPAVSEAFPTLTEDRSSDDVLPPAAAPVLQHFDDVNPELSQEVLSMDGQQLYLVPGDQHICTVQVSEFGIGGACAELGTATDPARPQVSVTTVPDGTRLTGVFPKGVSSVALATASGDQPIDLHDGAFSVDVPQGAGTLTWTTSDGATYRLSGAMPGASE